MIEGNNGWKPELVSNPDISQDYDIEINVNPTFDSTTINDNGIYNMIEGNNGWKPQLVSNPDPLQTYNLNIQVPQTINPLETITNKRLQSETTYTISSLMKNPTNNAGISKNSTIIVDLPNYPPTSSQKTLTLTQNTTTPQTIYPPTGEYWNSIRYSVNVNNSINYNLSNLNANKYNNVSQGDGETLLNFSGITPSISYNNWSELSSPITVDNNNGVYYIEKINNTTWVLTIAVGFGGSNEISFTSGTTIHYGIRFSNGWNGVFTIENSNRDALLSLRNDDITYVTYTQANNIVKCILYNTTITIQ